MPSTPLARARQTPRSVLAALVLALCAAFLLAAAVPASAITRKQATNKALAALGSKKGTNPVIVFGLKNSLGKGARVAVNGPKRSRLAIKFDKQRAFFFYEDSAPFQLYPHTGRVVLVGKRTGEVKRSRTIMWAPLVNGKLPPFLVNRTGYRTSQFRVYTKVNVGDPNAPNGNSHSPPKANPQTATVKRNVSKRITLTGDDDDGDLLTFTITKPADHGTLSGQAPDVIYTPNPNYVGADSFRFKTNDGDHESNSAKVSINVVPLGSPPTVTTSAGCTSYTEQSPAVFIDGALTVSDPDDTTLDRARVSIPQPAPTGGEDDPSASRTGDELVFTDQNGISGSYDERTGILDLNGTASVANYQAALRSVRYRNLTNPNPDPTRDVSFTVNDAGSDSAPATKQVCITEGGAGDNNKPTGETSEGGLNYTENDGPVPVDADFVALDADSANLSGATIKFVASQSGEEGDIGGGGPGTSTNNFVPAEDELAFADQNGITGSYNDTLGVLTLSGSSSVANYQAAIRSVTYENSSEDPSGEPRTLRFQVTDSSGANSSARARDVFVTPVNDAPVVTTSEGSASYVGTGPGVTIDSDLTTLDVDNTDLASAQVKISSGFESGDDLIYVDQLGIAGVYNTGSGILTLTGTASVANYQTALRSIKFRHAPGNAAGSRTIEYTVNDGELDSGTATKGIEVNDKPVLATTGTALSYTENDGFVAVDDAITATDADSATLSSATVKISSNFTPGEDALGFDDQNGITGAYDSDTGTMTLTGPASVADYETALRSVTYGNFSESPSEATRTVRFQVDDGGSSNNLSDPVTRDIDVTSVNDAPLVTTSEGSTSYTIGDDSGVAVDENLTVSDVDDTDAESASVRIADFEAGDVLDFTDQAGITHSYDSDTGVLTLTGPASVGDFETALRSVKYHTTAASPALSRTVEFTVNDGDADSEVASKSITLVPPVTDQAPVVTTSSGTTPYTLGDETGVVIDSELTVSDADDTNLEGARVQVEGFEPGDDLVWADQLDINGGFDSEVGVLTLTGTAPVADYQTALRSIKFRHFGDNQSAFRPIAFKVDDGDLESAFALKTIDLITPAP